MTIGGQDRILSLARDIGDRKVAEEALGRERGAVPRDVQCARSTAWRFGMPRASSSTPNPALWRMYGYDEPRSVGLRHSEWSGPAYPSDFIGAVAAGEPRNRDIQTVRKGGSAWRSSCTASRCSIADSRTY